MSATGVTQLQQFACENVQQDAMEFTGRLLQYLHTNGLSFLDTISARRLRAPQHVTEQMRQALTFEGDQMHSWVSEACTSTVTTTRTCKACAVKSYSFEAHQVLPVTVPDAPAGGSVSLRDCLAATFGTAPVEGAACPGCTAQALEYGSAFSRLSDTVVIGLQRFVRRGGGRGGFSKNTRAIVIPEELDLAPVSNVEAVSAMGGGGTRYRLCAVCHHRGTVEVGHCWASAQAVSDGRWRGYDDAKVYDCPCPSGPSTSAYLLFYKRVEE